MAETGPGEPAPKKYGLKPREFERVNAPRGTQGHSAAHDVYAIRQELRAREQAAGMDKIAPRPPKVSRRKRDYWLLLAIGNAVLVTLMVLSGNVVTLVFAGAGIIVYSAGLTWVMWQIMGDY